MPRMILTSFGVILLLLASTGVTQSHAIDPRFEIDPKTLETTSRGPGKRVSSAPEQRRLSLENVSRYTIKPGDYLLKILMKVYGLSENRARALIPEIKRLNDISDIRMLKVGATIVIPSTGGKVARRSKSNNIPNREVVAETYLLSMSQLASAHGSVNNDVITTVQTIWPKLVTSSSPSGMVELDNQNYSLQLDPQRYPTLPAVDGGSILLDRNGTLPPLVKSLLQDRNPKIRIVSGSSRNPRLFFSSLLSAAKFFSLEENPKLSFGEDPELSVIADFKIERTAESVLHEGTFLLNIGENRRRMPASLLNFLARQGVHVIEPFSSRQPDDPGLTGTVHQIDASEPRDIADRLIAALSLESTRDRMVDLYEFADYGVKLRVRADRYFEYRGERFVVSTFDNDPVNYTLVRVLEAMGYKVIMLEPDDDFQKVTENFISRLRLDGVYAMHSLNSQSESSYTVQLSGFMLRDRHGGNNMLLTDRELSPVIRDIIQTTGYRILSN